MALSMSMKENYISIGERLGFPENTEPQLSASTFSLSEATLNRLFSQTLLNVRVKYNLKPVLIPNEQAWICVSQAHANNQL